MWRRIVDGATLFSGAGAGRSGLRRHPPAVRKHGPVLQDLASAAEPEVVHEQAPMQSTTTHAWGAAVAATRTLVPLRHGSPAPPHTWAGPPPPPPQQVPSVPRDPLVEAAAGPGPWSRRLPGGFNTRGRGTTIGWLATLCTAATVALIVTVLSAGTGTVHTSTAKAPAPKHNPASTHPTGATPSPAAGAASRHAAVAAGSSSGHPAATGAPLSTAPPSSASPASSLSAPPGGPPVVTTISPTSGPAGTAVTLSGSGFFSSSGTIVVLFGQVQAPVSCPTQQTCVAQAPPQSVPPPSGAPSGTPPGPPTAGASAVPVTVTTNLGRSTAVVFTYTG